MKTGIVQFKSAALILMAAFTTVMTSCDKGDDPEPNPTPQEVKASDLDGTGGKGVYISVATGQQVSGADTAATSTKWDVKLKATTISFNNNTTAQLVSGVFDTYVTAPETGYTNAEIKGSGSWYTYTAMTAPQHAILPVAGKIIVVKTAANKYAKVEMISYYKGNPNTTTAAFADLATRPASPYYTFRVVYQADGSRNLK